MLNEALRMMFEYDRWATGRLLDVAEALTPEQLNTPGGAGYRSIRETLFHQVVTKQRWLSWWDGSMSLDESLSFKPDLNDYPDISAIRALWEDVETQTARFVDGLSDENAERGFDVDLPWDTPSTTFSLWQMMLHVANHGTQHRSEIAATLTSFDHSPGDIDLLFYYFDQLRQS